MKSLNRIFLIGNLGHTPELQTSKTGKAYCRLSVATNRVWHDEEDNKQQRTDWHSVFVFGTLAETCTTYLVKGSTVFVEGSLNQWDSEGANKHKQSINAHSVHFLKGGLDNSVGTRNHNAVAHLASS